MDAHGQLSFLKHESLLAGAGGFLFLLVLSGAATFLAYDPASEGRVNQPVAFNHRVHVEDEELECSICHMDYERETWSGLPSTSACALCHAEMQGESPEEAKLVRLIEEGVTLEWGSIFGQPHHVFFSHRRHVVVAGIECTTCHGDIGLSEAPPEARDPLTMEECIACHDGEAVDMGCTGCHR